ncbi:MAG: MMPL family transporter [Acidobacteriota bacterium]
MSPIRSIAGRPWTVLALVLGSVLAALIPASKLELQADLVSLLPDDAPAAEDYRTFLEHFGGAGKVFVLVESVAESGRDSVAGTDPAADSAVDRGGILVAAVDGLATRLGGSAEVAAVRRGLEPEDEAFFYRFVARRAPLLLPEAALGDLEARLSPERIRARARQLRSLLRTPAGGAQKRLLAVDPLGLVADLPGLSAAAGARVDPWTGGFRSNSGDAAMLMLTPRGSELDAAGGRELWRQLRTAFEEVAAEVDPGGRAGLRFHAVGGPLYAAQDEATLRRDLQWTVAGSALACALVLRLVFGAWRLPVALLVALGTALAWTAGALGLVLGRLSAVSLGFSAVLVGLGVDYGIHGGAHVRRALLGGADGATALRSAWRHAGAGIATTALTTAAGFATLAVAHFRPLRELGVVVAIGILAVLLASVTAGAAVVVQGAGGAPGRVWGWLERWTTRVVLGAAGRPRLVLALAAVLTAASAVGLLRLELSADPRALRPEDHPALAAEALLGERFDVGLDGWTVVVRGDDLPEALDRSAAVEALLESAGGGRVEVTSAGDWLAAGSGLRERLRRLGEMPFAAAADSLEAALLEEGLAPRGFAAGLDALRAFGTGLDPGAPGRGDWPDGLSELVRDSPDGGTLAALRVRVPRGLWPEGPPEELLGAIDTAAPGAGVAAATRLGAEMRSLAGQDLRRLAWVAATWVLLVVWLSFRGRPVRAALSLLPVTLGSIWVLGAWGALGRPLDLLGLAVVPMLLGIGIDDGLHAVHGARGGVGLIASVRSAALAMTVTTVTTCIGFGSLALSSVPGLRNGGLLVCAGVLACLGATLLVLPALAAYGKKEGGSKRPEKEAS